MRRNLRYLPFDFPRKLGFCERLFDPQMGKNLIYVHVSTSSDSKAEQSIVEALEWIVRRWGIENIAMDALGSSTQLSVEGRRITVHFGDGSQRSVSQSQYSKHDLVHPADRFLSRGTFSGRVYGLDHGYYYRQHVKTFQALYQIRRNLMRECERAWKAALAQAPQILNGLPLAILEKQKEVDASLFSYVHYLADSAIEMGVDVSRFPVIQILVKFYEVSIEWSVLLEAADKELDQFLEKIRPLTTRKMHEDLRTMRDDCEEADSIVELDSPRGKRQEFYRLLKKQALQCGIGLDEFTGIDTLATRVDEYHQMLSVMPGLDDEMQRLFKTIACCSSTSARTRSFVNLLDAIHLIHGMFAIKTTPMMHEHALVMRIGERELLEEFSNFGIPWGLKSGDLDKGLEFAKDYYYFGTVRSRHMADNIMQWFQPSRSSSGQTLLVITTGFQQPMVTGQLDHEQIACYLITPAWKDTKDTQHEEFLYRFNESIKGKQCTF